MGTDNLKESLRALHAGLESAGQVDEELKDLLLVLNGDIQHLLERGPDGPPDGGEGESTTYGLAERTQEITAKFAAQHPHLEPALRELGNALASMGI